jgi:hypothetical protein
LCNGIRVRSNQGVVHLELNIVPGIVDPDERFNPAALESIGYLSPDDILKTLKFARELHLKVHVSVVHTLNLDEYGQIPSFSPGGAETRHDRDHEFSTLYRG